MSNKFLDGFVDDMLNDMRRAGGAFADAEEELAKGLSDTRDEFTKLLYQVAESEVKHADDEAYQDRRNLEVGDRYYNDAIKVAIKIITAYMVCNVKWIGDACSNSEYDEYKEIFDKVFRNSRDRGGRDRDRDRDRGGRDRDRDRDRGGRDRDRDRDRDRGGRSERRVRRDEGRDDQAQAAYGRDNGRKEREERVPYERTSRAERVDRSSRGKAEHDDGVISRPYQIQDASKITLPLPGNALIDYDQGRNTGWVINPLCQRIKAALSSDNKMVAKVEMEPYEKHELGYAYGIIDTDEQVLPIVDFTKVPEFIDPSSLEQAIKWSLSKDEFTCYDQALNPATAMRSIDLTLDHARSDGTVGVANQVAEYHLPPALKADLEASNIPLAPSTFDEWAALMGMFKVYIQNNNIDADDRLCVQQAYAAIDAALCRMLNDMLRINHNGWSASGEFADDWPDVVRLLMAEENKDDMAIFQREEQAFLNSYVKATYGMDDNNRWVFTVTVRYLVLVCTDYFLGANLLPTRINRYCDIDPQLTPEFYSAVQRVLRLRNNRHAYTPVLLADANRQPLRLVGGKLEGAKTWLMLGHS